MQMKIDVVVLWDRGRFECLVFDDSCPECALCRLQPVYHDPSIKT